MKRLSIDLINVYQKLKKTLSVFSASLFPAKACRFTPSCSQYTKTSITRYGILKGVLMGLGRIIRCHPLKKGGFDPVP